MIDYGRFGRPFNFLDDKDRHSDYFPSWGSGSVTCSSGGLRAQVLLDIPTLSFSAIFPFSSHHPEPVSRTLSVCTWNLLLPIDMQPLLEIRPFSTIELPVLLVEVESCLHYFIRHTYVWVGRNILAYPHPLLPVTG